MLDCRNHPKWCTASFRKSAQAWFESSGFSNNLWHFPSPTTRVNHSFGQARIEKRLTQKHYSCSFNGSSLLFQDYQWVTRKHGCLLAPITSSSRSRAPAHVLASHKRHRAGVHGCANRQVIQRQLAWPQHRSSVRGDTTRSRCCIQCHT